MNRRDEEKLILTQKEMLKYLKAGVSSALTYELINFIPFSHCKESYSFAAKYVIFRILHAVAL